MFSFVFQTVKLSKLDNSRTRQLPSQSHVFNRSAQDLDRPQFSVSGASVQATVQTGILFELPVAGCNFQMTTNIEPLMTICAQKLTPAGGSTVAKARVKGPGHLLVS